MEQVSVGRRFARGLTVLAVVVVAAGSLAACSGSSGSDGAARGTSSTTSTIEEDLYDGPDAGANVLTGTDLPADFTPYPPTREPRRADEPPPKVDDGSGLCGLANPVDTGDPLDRIQVGYSRRTGGPFVYESVGIYRTEEEAERVMAEGADSYAACVLGGADQDPPIVGREMELDQLGDERAGFVVEVPSAAGGDEAQSMGEATTTTTAASMGQPAQPMGGGPSFYVECGFSHRAIADPIVFPSTSAEPTVTAPETSEHSGHEGMEGMGGPGMVDGVSGHSHDFFGATTTDATSTADSLVDGDTTCAESADRSAYWVPTLYLDGSAVEPVHVRVWYSAPDGIDPSTIEPLPTGLKMIAGNIAAKKAQPTEVVGWRCGDELGQVTATAPSGCTEDQPLVLRLRFPSCWDGEDLDSTDHKSHMAYPEDGACPADHPVAVPQIQMVVDYGISGPTEGIELAMGSPTGAHGDVFVGWKGDRQETLIERCLETGSDCGAGKGPEGDFPAHAHAVLMRKGSTIVVLAVASFDPLDVAFTQDLAAKAIERIPAS